MGGEKCTMESRFIHSGGSPPRGRGKAGLRIKNGRLMGITPAWAGKRVKANQTVPKDEDHPRVGGEKGTL